MLFLSSGSAEDDDASNPNQLSEARPIGWIGFTNLVILSILTIWRTTVFISRSNKIFWKRICTCMCLLLAAVSDIPMYVSFILLGEYESKTYAFHKLENFFLISALAITIHECCNTLYEIKEDTAYPFLLKKISLIVLTFIVFVVSVLNFGYCLAMNDINAFVQTPIYVTGIVTQFVSAALLVFFMLKAGLRLASRIKGATDTTSRISNVELIHALRRLNWVFGFVALTCLSQVTLLILNFSLGYASNSSTVGPMYFYWIFYAWVPLWGTICPLLYLITIAPPDQPKNNAADNSNSKSFFSVFSPWSSKESNDLESKLMVADSDNDDNRESENSECTSQSDSMASESSSYSQQGWGDKTGDYVYTASSEHY